MIGYLDASALVKRYVAEPGSELVLRFIADAEAVGTALISRVEVTAALAKAIRVGALETDEALASRQLANQEWRHLVRVPVTDALADRAATLAWSENLRGYDAVQLAAACAWQEALGEPISFAAFDVRLWAAASRQGLAPFPDDLPSLLAGWRSG